VEYEPPPREWYHQRVPIRGAFDGGGLSQRRVYKVPRVGVFAGQEEVGG
jgi:hypothetical protein